MPAVRPASPLKSCRVGFVEEQDIAEHVKATALQRCLAAGALAVSRGRSSARDRADIGGFTGVDVFIVLCVYSAVILPWRVMYFPKKLIAGLLAAPLCFLLVLKFGLLEGSQEYSGPFPMENGRMLIVPVGQDSRLARLLRHCCLTIVADSSEEPTASNLRLFVNGREYATGHAYHNFIREGRIDIFSHWVDSVRFALPEGVANDERVRIQVRYSLGFPFARLGWLVIIGLVFLVARLLQPSPSEEGSLHTCYKTGTFLEVLHRIPFLVLRLFLWASVLAAVIYLLTIVYALGSGYALPTAAIFRWSDIARALGMVDVFVVQAALLLAAICALSAWAGEISGVYSPVDDAAHISLLLKRFGLILTVVLFVFSVSGCWGGLVRPNDFNQASIAGLIPLNDAHGYFASANDQARDGVWSKFSLRRPLAMAARSILMWVSGFSYSTMLLAQSVLCAGAVWVAAQAVLLWRGPLACVVFIGISFLVLRSFLATTLTEPIGLFWGLLSVRCFIQALRTRSLNFALLAFAATTIGLMTRMGAMLFIPALALWLVIHFGSSWRGKIKVAIAIVAVAASVWATNQVLSKTYGNGDDLTGSNFAHVLCGLSLGINWSECTAQYVEQLKRFDDDKAYSDFLYRTAIENIRNQPSVIVLRLIEGGSEFARSVPETLTRGYLQLPEDRWLPLSLFFTSSGVGLIMLLMRRSSRPSLLELSFWALAISSILASSMFVYFDDGRRAMAVSYPLLALALASCFAISGPLDEKARGGRASLGWVGVGAYLLGLIALPWIIHHTAGDAISAGSKNQQIVFGGRRITGTLVVADDQELPTEVPSIHMSDFAKLIDLTHMEILQPIGTGRVRALPFGFIAAPRREAGINSYTHFIVPPEVLFRRDVSSWKFSTVEWSHSPSKSTYWLLVESAEPLTAAPN